MEEEVVAYFRLCVHSRLLMILARNFIGVNWLNLCQSAA